MKLAYQPYKSWSDGRTIFKPVVDLLIVGPKGESPWPALADTGSDLTLIPRLVAEETGIELDARERITSISGQDFQVFMSYVDLELRDDREIFRWRAKVGVYGGGSAVLGHEGFFDLFHASFDNERRSLTIRPHKRAPVGVTPIP